MVKFFERQVEKKAERMLKHKRLFAYFMMCQFIFHLSRLTWTIYKNWDEWHLGAMFKTKKKDDKEDGQTIRREETDTEEY